MTPEQFRAMGHRAVDWIADYLERIEQFPVLSQVEPGRVRAGLPAHPPREGEPFDAVLADLDRVVLPGVTHWQHPGFFGYFPANSSGPAIIGELLSAGLGVQGMLWATSPACTELETVVVDWMAELLGLPAHFRTDDRGGGSIQDSASSSVLVALVAALRRARAGSATARPTVYLTAQAHSSVEKAARIAGLDADALRVVDVDPDTLAMDPGHLAALIDADVAAGLAPAMVCATIGTTATGAIDPVRRIGEVTTRHGVWLHIDAAWAGSAAVCPELRWINDGVAEHADSYCMDPHKWLLTNFDCSLLWVADRAPLIEALSIMPEYLRNRATESGAVIDYRDWQVPLGRRFRALKLWLVIRWYGARGLAEHIRTGVRLAQHLAAMVADDPGFELLPHHPLGLVCFRPLWPGADPDDADRRTLDLLERLNAGGQLYLTHAKVHDRVVLRFAVGSPQTRDHHVEAAWRGIREQREAGLRVGATGR
ncbi:pyridoxal-dependent decarboxylase [Pseudonocardia lacus]|uniref:pyridoxal-dependent decarboxylase n=1 Tax=Pseudonocardia lacus TaxID=2835865 RepID=UPI001BDD9F70|nr:pyridoxal-dependent decarboxylase [Pseudonocardia lacus]